MLHGIVDLATEATDCHACFIYLLENGRLTIRAASPTYAQEVAAAGDAELLAATVARRLRELLGAEVCQLYRLSEDGTGLQTLACDPEAVSAVPGVSTAGLLIAALDGGRERPPGGTLWPGLAIGDVLMTPLSAGGERIGLICAGTRPGRSFRDEDGEIARAVAHLTAIAIKRAELIRGLTTANIVKDLFEALAAGATAFAASKAAEDRKS